ncbi:MAG: ArsR/SmtB family transcription factor [Acidobacteriota bacterium]
MHISEIGLRSTIDRIEILKVIAHPMRIMILKELATGVKCLSDFGEFLDISQPNVSQHLSLLRRYGIIDYFIDGRLRCYFLKDPMVPDVLEVLRKEYSEDLPAPACCPVAKKGTYLENDEGEKQRYKLQERERRQHEKQNRATLRQ